MRTLLKTFAAMAAIMAYLVAVETVLSASSKSDRLPLYVACAAADYEMGVCL
jgi:hypothetical protein